MDFKNMRKITEANKIHDELFSKSLYHDYYDLGIAHGLYFTCKLLNKFKNGQYTSEQFIEIIKKATDQHEDGKVKEYFTRLMLDLEEN